MTMISSAGKVFLLHAPGRADIGVSTSPEDPNLEEQLLKRLSTDEPGEVTRLLRLMDADQIRAKAPLAACMELIMRGDQPAPQVHLVMVSTDAVLSIARAIQIGLRTAPDAYGHRFSGVTIVRCPGVIEAETASRVADYLSDTEPATDRVVVSWGSGATQVTLGIIGAVIDTGLPYSLACTSKYGPAQEFCLSQEHPAATDWVIAILRRWRCHDLLADMVAAGELDVSPAQRLVIEAEAEQWGRAHTAPTANGLRAVMAAALMRNDATSGFAVRAYVERHYHELRQQEAGGIDLFDWAEKVNSNGPATLGRILGLVRQEKRNQEVVRAKALRSGQWLLSKTVNHLNDLGKRSSHEHRPADAADLRKLRAHLKEVDDAPELTAELAEAYRSAGMSQLSPVPSRRAWYVAVLGLERPDPDNREVQTPLIQQIVDAASNPAHAARLDVPVRQYLGVLGNDPMPIGMLVLGTESKTAPAARDLAQHYAGKEGLDGDRVLAESAVIHDATRRSPNDPVFQEELANHLRRLVDPGALVVVPTGRKEDVLPLLAAAQRVGAERGIPVYLRELVDEWQDVLTAGVHRLPLRFGVDRAILNATCHAIDTGELDTAARLAGALPLGQAPARELSALALALRCDLRQRNAWPFSTAPVSDTELTHGMIAKRIELWAGVARGATDDATQLRAVLGAYASAEASIKEYVSATTSEEVSATQHDAQKKARDELHGVLSDLNEVRNKLPFTHGDGLPSGGADGLVAKATNTRFTTVVDLLDAAVKKAREHYGCRPDHLPSLERLRMAGRQEICQLMSAGRSW